MTAPGQVRQTTTSSFKTGSWAGDLDDLRKLIRECRKLEATAKKQATENLRSSEKLRKASWAKVIESFGWTAEKIDEEWPEHDEREIAEAVSRTELALSVKERKWNRELSGVPEDVIEEINPHDVKSLEISLGVIYGSYPIGFKMEFGRTVGASVQIVSVSSEFVLVASDALRPRFVEQRPWYWWLSSYRVGIPLWMVPGALFVLPHLSGVSSPPAYAAAAFAILLWDALVSVGVVSLIRLLIPAFELYRAGSRPRGARILAGVGAAILWIVPVVLPYVHFGK